MKVLIVILPMLCLHFFVQGKQIDPSDHDRVFAEVEGLRLGVVGLSHDHVHWILRQAKSGLVDVVGIVETDQALIDRLQRQYSFSSELIYRDIATMLDAASPNAVAAFNMISQHIDVVEACAPRGIDVMVEKPLAANLEQAQRMLALASEHGIHLLTNYETTWYGSNAKAYEIIHSDDGIGELRKIIFKTGHKGPREIGCSEEFLFWLTDPIKNGGGALTDFGCYGANISTWIMEGKRPETVSCITQQMKPNIYPKVEDEATIILTYPGTQIIIQASWNWTYGRKDMEVYGTEGYVVCENGQDMIVMRKQDKVPTSVTARKLQSGMDDPFAFLEEVVSGRLIVPVNSPSSMENNLIVMQILEAAKESARTGATVNFQSFLNRN